METPPCTSLVTNVYALEGLAGSAYCVYEIQPLSNTNVDAKVVAGRTIAERVRFLEQGVGVEVAAMAAALAMVNDSGTALASVLPKPLKPHQTPPSPSSLESGDIGDQSSSRLWVFCAAKTHQDEQLAEWDANLAPYFTPLRRGVWGITDSPHSNPDTCTAGSPANSPVTEAMLAAVRENIMRTLMRKGFVRLESEMILPDHFRPVKHVVPATGSSTFTAHSTTPGPTTATTPGTQVPVSAPSPYAPSPGPMVTTTTGTVNATAKPPTNEATPREANAYRVIPFLSSSDHSQIAVRIVVRRATYVFVSEADLEAGTPFVVCTSPHGTPGTLVPLKSAGEGLAANVLSRWQEAGLIPIDESAAEYEGRTTKSVVYVRQGPTNEEVPIPRRCVLRLIEINKKASDDKTSIKQQANVILPDFGVTAVAQMLWKAKKRPRSPATSTHTTDYTSPRTEVVASPMDDLRVTPKIKQDVHAPQDQYNGPAKVENNKIPKAQQLQGLNASNSGVLRTRESGCDQEICGLANVEDFLGIYGGTSEKPPEKVKGENVSSAVPAVELAPSPPGAKKPEPMDVDPSACVPLDPADPLKELQRLYEEDLRARVSDTFARTGFENRSARSQILSLPLMNGGISKQRVNSFRYRQTLRSLYVPTKKSKLMASGVNGRPKVRLLPMPKKLATPGKLDSISLSVVDDSLSESSDTESEETTPDVLTVPDLSQSTTPAAAVAIDCASVCFALRSFEKLFSALESAGDELFTQAEKGHIIATEKTKIKGPIGAILALMDMQVLGNVDMWLQHPLAVPRRRTREKSTPESRKSLFSFPRLVKEAWLNAKSEPFVLVGPLSIDTLPTAITRLPTPRVCVGYGEDWIETSKSVLPLWEKAGLNPFSGPKNVRYAVLAPKWKAADVQVFFRDLSTAYEECRFGLHSPLPHDSTVYVGDADVATGMDTGHSEESQLLTRYTLAISGLASKLEATAPEYSNCRTVVYIVSPFPALRQSANGSLLKALAPLASLKLSSSSSGGVAPWKAPSQETLASPPVIKLFSAEVLVRSFSTLQSASSMPLRPQMMKGFASSVYDTLRGRSLRGVAEMTAISSGYGNISGEMMSPVTPDQASSAPTSGRSASSVAGSQDALADIGACRGRSVLYEPAVVLAGVGSHLNGDDSQREGSCMVFHICYSYCKETRRFYSGLSDSRGESLDFFTSPELDVRNSEERRRAFALMWNRGRRWWLSFVETVRVVVSKLEAMECSESSDWAALISDLLAHQGLEGTNEAVCRFQGRNGTEELSNFFEKTGYSLSTDTDMASTIGNPRVASVSIVSIEENDSLNLLSRREQSERGESEMFSYIHGCEQGLSHAAAFLVDAAGSSIPIKLSLLRHFGALVTNEGDQHGEPRSLWDSKDCRAVVGQIARNFHELSALSAPPAGPQDRWDCPWPRHVQVVQNLRRLGRILL